MLQGGCSGTRQPLHAAGIKVRAQDRTQTWWQSAVLADGPSPFAEQETWFVNTARRPRQMSKKVRPRSTAVRRRAVIACASLGGPSESSFPCSRDSTGLNSFHVTLSKFAFLHCFSLATPIARFEPNARGNGSLQILPSSCLFLLRTRSDRLSQKVRHIDFGDIRPT